MNLSETIMCFLCHVINWCGDVIVHALRRFCLTCKRASHVGFQELEIEGYGSQNVCHGTLFVPPLCYENYAQRMPWSWALLEKLPVAQLLKDFPSFNRTRMFITVFTRVHYWSLPWMRSVHTAPSHLSQIHFICFATVVSEPTQHERLAFHVPNLMSIFPVSVQVRSPL
jgi:hypothetical protein